MNILILRIGKCAMTVSEATTGQEPKTHCKLPPLK